MDERLEALERGIHAGEEDVERAKRAREILSDPMVEEAFASIESTWTEAWKSSRLDDVAGRERAYAALRASLDFREHFRVILERGEASQTLLKEMHREREGLLRRVARVVGL